MTRFNILGTAAGVNTTRAILGSVSALAMLTALCGAADATTMHHARPMHHHYVAPHLANSFAYEPTQAPVRYYTPGYDEAPTGHEASTYGGVTLLPDD